MQQKDQSLQGQIKIYLSHLDGLIARGRQLREGLVIDPLNEPMIAATRAWQEECGVTINQLSGGSKAHWLARSFSTAFLMRGTTGRALESASPGEIVTNLLDVLEQAIVSLTQEENGPVISASPQGPPPRRFEFVHNAGIRPVIEQAYLDIRRAIEAGHYGEALRISSGILEAIVTDALEHYELEHQGLSAIAASQATSGEIAEWSFDKRLAIAEKAGLIRGGCARLPAVARSYRDHGENVIVSTISEREARQAGQVLHVIIRDLDPGR